MKHRIATIDAARGVAVLMVVWFHMTNQYTWGHIVRQTGHYGYLGVDVFFVISGFIIPFALYMGSYEVTRHWATFIKKRILRIDPPYLIAAVLTLGLWYLPLTPDAWGTPPDYFSWKQMALHLGYLNGFFEVAWANSVFWTLAIEFQFYLLVSLMFPAFKSSNRLIRISVILGFLLISFPFATGGNVYVLKFLGVFALGILTFQYFAKIIDVKEFLVMAAISTVFIHFTLGQGWAVTGIITALVIAFIKVGKIRGLAFFGAISYSLYLIHLPIGKRVMTFVGPYFGDTSLDYLFVSLSGLTVSVVVAFIFYKLFEKQAQAWSARIKYKKREPRPTQTTDEMILEEMVATEPIPVALESDSAPDTGLR